MAKGHSRGVPWRGRLTKPRMEPRRCFGNRAPGRVPEGTRVISRDLLLPRALLVGRHSVPYLFETLHHLVSCVSQNLAGALGRLFGIFSWSWDHGHFLLQVARLIVRLVDSFLVASNQGGLLSHFQLGVVQGQGPGLSSFLFYHWVGHVVGRWRWSRRGRVVYRIDVF